MKKMSIEEAKKRLTMIITTKFNNDYSIDSTDKEAIEKVLNELEKQNKIIDEMALHIASSAIVDDTVCMYVDCNNEECHSDTAIECTKQYFYRKVEGNE